MNKDELLYRLASAGFSGDKKTIYRLSLRAMQLLKKSDESGVLDKINDLVSSYSIGQTPLRSIGYENVPLGIDDRAELLDINMHPDAVSLIYNKKIWLEVESFLKERAFAGELLKEGVTPPASLLLYGKPGTGKTKLAEYIACKLGKPLFVLNLATAISSYLGKTGQNLKSALGYAQESGAVILLDEFDSIAKKRDDPSDLGELKRIVNVLLKELEDWDHSSVIIGATNHPELLDIAIWRRFDVSIQVTMPEKDERLAIFKSHMPTSKTDKKYFEIFTELAAGLSPALIENSINWAKRKSIIGKSNIELALISSLVENNPTLNKKSKSEICKKLKELVPDLTYKEIGEMFNLSPSTICYHVGK